MTIEMFVTEDKVRVLGNLPGANMIADEKINIHFPTAKMDMLDKVGQDKYTELEGNGAGNADYDRLQTAESYYVLSYLIPALNVLTTGAGIVRNTGWDADRKELLSPSDIQTLVEGYRSNAERLLEQYVKSVDTDEDENEDIVMTSAVKMIAI